MIADLEHTFIKKLWQLKQRTVAKGSSCSTSVQEFAENKILEIMRTARVHAKQIDLFWWRCTEYCC